MADTLNGLTQGTIFEMSFTFREPALDTILSKFSFVPEEYQQFLRLQDGAYFFTFEYGGSFQLYSIEEAISQYDFFKKNDVIPAGMDWFPIGMVTDMRELCIDLTYPKKPLLLVGVSVCSFSCTFDAWLDRMIQVNGAYFWQWAVTEFDIRP